jgi:hypothetical protein
MEEHLPPDGWLGDLEKWGPALFFPERKKRERGYHPGPAWVYLYLDDCGEDDLEIHLLSALPDLGRKDRFMTWLEYEVTTGDMNWQWMFGIDQHWEADYPTAAWAMTEGLCPGQWFIARVHAHYHEPLHLEDDFDIEYNGEILSKEILNPLTVALSWEAWLRERDYYGSAVPVEAGGRLGSL